MGEQSRSSSLIMTFTPCSAKFRQAAVDRAFLYLKSPGIGGGSDVLWSSWRVPVVLAEEHWI